MNSTKKSSTTDLGFWLLVVGIVLAILLGLGAVWHGTSEQTRLVKLVETAAAMLAASGVILATYLSVKQSKETLRRLESDTQRAEELRQQNIDRDKLEETFRLIEKWDDPHFLEARVFSRRLGKDIPTLTPPALVQKVEEDEELKSSIALMLNYFDFIRLSIKHDRVHPDLIRTQLGHMSIVILNRFSAWIDSRDPIYRKDVDEFRKFMM